MCSLPKDRRNYSASSVVYQEDYLSYFFDSVPLLHFTKVLWLKARKTYLKIAYFAPYAEACHLPHSSLQYTHPSLFPRRLSHGSAPRCPSPPSPCVPRRGRVRAARRRRAIRADAALARIARTGDALPLAARAGRRRPARPRPPARRHPPRPRLPVLRSKSFLRPLIPKPCHLSPRHSPHRSSY